MFPVDWDAWRLEWETWLRQARVVLALRPLRKPSPFPVQKNILADERLGEWQTIKGPVELSELTMPDFTKPPTSVAVVRRVGITWGLPDGTTKSGGVVGSWVELEQELGIGRT